MRLVVVFTPLLKKGMIVIIKMAARFNVSSAVDRAVREARPRVVDLRKLMISTSKVQQ